MAFLKTSEAPATVVEEIPAILLPDATGLRFDHNKYDMTKAKWDALPADVQDEYIEEIFTFYRKVWGFPYALKTGDTFAWKFGIYPDVDVWVNGIIEFLYAKDFKRASSQAGRLRKWDSSRLLIEDNLEVDYHGGGFFEEEVPEVDDDVQDTSRHLKQNLMGMGAANSFMPHLHHTPVKGLKSPFDGFWDDKLFRKAIRLACRWDSGAWPHSIRYGLRSIGGIQSVGNFKPTVVKFLHERFTPKEGGIVFDFSCGWGGRLTGARSSRKDLLYVGVDPSTKTFECLQNLDAFLCKLYGYEVGEVTNVKVNGRMVPQYRGRYVRITLCGSEEFRPTDLLGKVDFAFSSPPYFDLEDYAAGDEGYENQSHVKFPGRDGWLNGFLKQTADNVAALLKPGGYCGLNLADFRDTNITADACAVFETAGLTYKPDENFEMRISVRTGNRSKAKTEKKKHKTETIFIFKKE